MKGFHQHLNVLGLGYLSWRLLLQVLHVHLYVLVQNQNGDYLLVAQVAGIVKGSPTLVTVTHHTEHPNVPVESLLFTSTSRSFKILDTRATSPERTALLK